MAIFSRRDLVRLCASLFTPLRVRNAAAQPVTPANLKIGLVQEFAQSSVKALSPDGTRLCVEDWAERGYPLRVVEIGTWQTVYSGRFQSRTLGSSFFADSQALLVRALGSLGKGTCGAGKGNCTHQEVVVHLRTGERTERALGIDLNRGENFWALSEGILLDAYYERKPYRTETLALVEFPELREIAKVPYATQPREPQRRKGNFELSNDFGFGVSDDRKILSYSFDHILLCRRTEDLGVLWTRRVEPQLNAYKVVVSAGGSHVAAAIADGGFTPAEQHSSYIAVYEGKTGADVARLLRSGTEGIALSPDGKFIAVVAREHGDKGELVPTVYIHDVQSGQKLASVAHGRVKSGRRQFLEAGCTVAFTSDGKYLVTSGMGTKVWRFGD